MQNHMKRLETLKAAGVLPTNILDIGAHHGAWSTMALSVFQNAHILLVEANPDLEPTLTKTGFDYHIALLGDTVRSNVNFFDASIPCKTGNSIYREMTSVPFKPRQLEMTTLDLLLKENRKCYDFIKMDVQGSELNILKGAPHRMKDAAFFLLELQVIEYNIGAPMIDEMIVFMQQNGFAIKDIFDLGYLPDKRLAYVDVLFSRL